jgi:hypothetical protein
MTNGSPGMNSDIGSTGEPLTPGSASGDYRDLEEEEYDDVPPDDESHKLGQLTATAIAGNDILIFEKPTLEGSGAGFECSDVKEDLTHSLFTLLQISQRDSRSMKPQSRQE